MHFHHFMHASFQHMKLNILRNTTSIYYSNIHTRCVTRLHTMLNTVDYYHNLLQKFTAHTYIPTMSSVTCTPQVRQKRKVTQPAFTRVHSHNFLHSCAITYMRQTHNAHNILTLATVTFKTFSTLYVIHICLLRQG